MNQPLAMHAPDVETAADATTTSVGRTFPVRAVELLVNDALQELRGVTVGAALEVPAEELLRLDPDLLRRVEGFYHAARRLWSDNAVMTRRAVTFKPDAGQGAADVWLNAAADNLPVGAVLVEVPLGSHRQTDRKPSRSIESSGRKDLKEILAAVEVVPELALLDQALEAHPDWSLLAASSGHGPLEVVRDDDRTILTFDVARSVWPLELGGPPCPGEIVRRLVFEVSHAAWRDRKVRRMLSVTVSAFEIWPDPALW